MITKNRAAETYRGFSLDAWQYAQSGDWSGMAKGLGTVLLPGVFPTAEAVLMDLRRRVDLGYQRGMGVFAGR